MQMNTGTTVKDNIGHTNANDLRDPCTGVVEHRQEQVITPRGPGIAGLPQNGKHFLAGEKSEHGPLVTFHRHRQCAFNHMQ